MSSQERVMSKRTIKNDIPGQKRFSFALQKEHKEYILSKQVLRSGTVIGALNKRNQICPIKS
jgi:hypothetical protein